MYKKYAVEWVKALRSGKYKQAQRILCRVDDDGNKSYCCLGVLCELVKVKKHKTNAGGFLYGKEKNLASLPKEVMKKTNIKNSLGDIEGNGMPTLSYLNDSGKTFEEIAEVIENEYKNI